MSKVEVSTAQNVRLDYRPAHVGDRILGAIVDVIVLLAYIIGVAILSRYTIYNQASISESTAAIFFTLFSLPLFFYSLLMEAFFNGQTIGKMAANTRVIMVDGTQPSIGAYFLRWVFRIVDIHLLSGAVAIICIIATKNSQRLGDIVAGTTVIKLSRRTHFSELLPEKEPVQHKVVFMQAANLKEEDVRLIKDGISSYYKTGNYYLIDTLAKKVKSVYGIQSDMAPDKFLKTLLDDYSAITYRETSFSSWK